MHQRPFDPKDRSEAGHWEGDLIVGKDQGSAIGTLVERQSRVVRLLHLPCRQGEALYESLRARMADLPPTVFRSVTWDQGTEMARHIAISKSLGVQIYFCDSHSPWQRGSVAAWQRGSGEAGKRGSNENSNGLLRDYFPKGTDLRIHSVDHLRAVEDELNNGPRLVLDGCTPAERFAVLLASGKQSVLRR